MIVLRQSQGARRVALVCFALLGSACSPDTPPPPPIASTASVTVVDQKDGVTPFIKFLNLSLDRMGDVASVAFVILPAPGAVSRPVSVSYSKAYIDRRGFYAPGLKQLVVPVFGLYAGAMNQVELTVTYADGSKQSQAVGVMTASYQDPGGIYDKPDVKVARAGGDALSYSYFMIKGLTGPVVIDTDARIRWVGKSVGNSLSAAYVGDGFVVGSSSKPEFTKVQFDGTYSVSSLRSGKYTKFHHNLEPGKQGLLAELDANIGGPRIEANLAEIDEAGNILKEWDFSDIFRAAMVKAGDEPSNFVRDGVDWFHVNSAIYSPEDDSLIVSSRENFVVKVDYSTGDIKWILGDTTKHWYVDYPSLQAFALQVTGKAPIGQHALSISSSGDLLLFNDGYASVNQPSGTAIGDNRTFSAASMYRIDEDARTADELWTFEDGQSIYSDICSSVYEGWDNDYLVNYSVAYNRTKAKLVGLDRNGVRVFDFEYPTSGCATSWNATIIGFDGLSF